MNQFRLLLSASVFGLAAGLASSSLAQPEGGKPGPPPGAPKAPGAPRAPDAPRGPGGPMPGKRIGEPRAKGQAGKPGNKGNKGNKGPKGRKGKGRKRGMGNKAAARRMELQAKKLEGKLTKEETEELEGLWQRRFERAKRPGPHRERFLELIEKEKEGKLTEEEKEDLKQVLKIRQRHRRLMQRDARRDKSRKNRIRKARRQLLAKMPGLQKNEQARAELKKHAMREAMLERARDIARAEGLTKLIARADKLIAQENTRHDKWMSAHLAQVSKGGEK